MTMNRVPFLWLSLGLCAAPTMALAQLSGESTDMGPRAELRPSVAASAADQRSPLWMAVDAVHRQREAGSPDRRLTAEQRLQAVRQIHRSQSIEITDAVTRPLPNPEQVAATLILRRIAIGHNAFVQRVKGFTPFNRHFTQAKVGHAKVIAAD